MSVALLDVNLLLALADPMHLHHEPAHRWFARVRRSGWATCPITENGFVRIASHPGYPNRPGDAPLVLNLLRQMCADDHHYFWPDSISIRESLRIDTVFTHNQTTDIYLVCLALTYGGRLVTFDQRIPASIVPGGTAALEVIDT